MNKDIYRTDPDGEPDYDGYEEIEEDEYDSSWVQDTYLW